MHMNGKEVARQLVLNATLKKSLGLAGMGILVGASIIWSLE